MIATPLALSAAAATVTENQFLRQAASAISWCPDISFTLLGYFVRNSFSDSCEFHKQTLQNPPA